VILYGLPVVEGSLTIKGDDHLPITFGDLDQYILRAYRVGELDGNDVYVLNNGVGLMIEEPRQDNVVWLRPLTEDERKR